MPDRPQVHTRQSSITWNLSPRPSEMAAASKSNTESTPGTPTSTHPADETFSSSPVVSLPLSPLDRPNSPFRRLSRTLSGSSIFSRVFTRERERERDGSPKSETGGDADGDGNSGHRRKSSGGSASGSMISVASNVEVNRMGERDESPGGSFFGLPLRTRTRTRTSQRSRSSRRDRNRSQGPKIELTNDEFDKRAARLQNSVETILADLERSAAGNVSSTAENDEGEPEDMENNNNNLDNKSNDNDNGNTEAESLSNIIEDTATYTRISSKLKRYRSGYPGDTWDRVKHSMALIEWETDPRIKEVVTVLDLDTNTGNGNGIGIETKHGDSLMCGEEILRSTRLSLHVLWNVVSAEPSLLFKEVSSPIEDDVGDIGGEVDAATAQIPSLAEPELELEQKEEAGDAQRFGATTSTYLEAMMDVSQALRTAVSRYTQLMSCSRDDPEIIKGKGKQMDMDTILSTINTSTPEATRLEDVSPATLIDLQLRGIKAGTIYDLYEVMEREKEDEVREWSEYATLVDGIIKTLEEAQSEVEMERIPRDE